ncbi:DUF2097 domain-containing protein [Methanobacterium alcaliphilum]|uniref:DUF2097 domain-containing protein n=1 Tax=Methanobacterium alcaliphilum TaxID=392018 RepID=UPI00200A8BB1|nr:DUF2097 domain-containing protein [Methanobacterium alcaliphilum]MCK9151964.1 DUF2097 domain-containing protein [Methanobacterium alcaliphilum]
MEEEITLSFDETVNYVKNNVKHYDVLEISYNRVFAPGEVLGIDTGCGELDECLIIKMQLNGETLNQVVDIDLHEIKGDLLEMRHVNEEKTTIIVVDD